MAKMTAGPVAGECSEAGHFKDGLEAATSSQLCLVITQQTILNSRTLSQGTIGRLSTSQEGRVLIGDEVCLENPWSTLFLPLQATVCS